LSLYYPNRIWSFRIKRIFFYGNRLCWYHGIDVVLILSESYL